MSDLLRRVSQWSSCCWAKIIDPGNTGEWICAECKEHCSEEYTEEVDIAVLDFANTDIYIDRLEYDSIDHPTVEEFVDDYLTFKYGWTDNLQYMIAQVKPIRIWNERDVLETE